jgi:TolC family type I secretion outer membrane protein
MQKRLLVLACALALSSGAHALTLKEALASAEQIDPTVQGALANSNAAQAGIQVARSKLLPTVQGVGSYGRTNQTATQADINGNLYGQKFINSTPNSQVYLKQALFHMADWAGLNASQLQNEYGLVKLAGAYGDLWLRVSSAWFDLIAAQETLDIQQDAERSMTQIALQAQKSYEAGIGTKDSALESKAQLAFTHSNVVEAELTLAARQKSFAALTGIDMPTLQSSHVKFTNKYRLLPGNEKRFIEKANDESPELVASRLTEELRRMQLKQARYGSYPTVDLYGSYQQTQNANINQIGLGVISSQVAVQVVIPFYSGGLYEGQERQAAAYLESASADIKAAELKLSTSVQTYWATQEAQIDRAKAVQEMVSAGQEVVNAYRMGVTAGLKSWSDVANAEVVLTRRRVDQVNALSTLLKAQAQILSNLPVNAEDWQVWLNTLTFETKKVASK